MIDHVSIGVSDIPRSQGLHVYFDAPTREGVDASFKAAVAAGGRDNGKPSLRDDYGANYYAAFVIALDGYRVEAYCSRAG